GVADDVDRIEHNVQHVAQRHHGRGHELRAEIQQDRADDHDDVADQHEGTELTELAVGLVHQCADDGVGDSVEQTHDRDHRAGKDDRQAQNTAVVGDVGRGQDVVDIGRTVVEGKQDQLV